ncbi:hypothetical protein Trydic_g18892 [Trypoxylus dichotomus]
MSRSGKVENQGGVCYQKATVIWLTVFGDVVDRIMEHPKNITRKLFLEVGTLHKRNAILNFHNDHCIIGGVLSSLENIVHKVPYFAQLRHSSKAAETSTFGEDCG